MGSMFDSVSGGYAPICGLVLILAWFIAPLRHWSVKILFAVVGPVLICLGWAFLPQFPHWFKPLPFGQDDWVPWALIAAIIWSRVAIPLSVVAVVLLSLWRCKRRSPR
jgi:hypothetical protein